MLKVLTVIARARAARAAEELADRDALLILDGQIRDARRAVERCRRALAVAAAQDEGEGRRLAALAARMRDLEERAVAALRDGAEDLAARSAEAIAALDADREAGERDRARFAAEFARLRRDAASAERRLAELDRGRRAAEAAEALRRLRNEGVPADPATGPVAGPGALEDAEATLARLRDLQARDAAAAHILDGLTRDGSADALRDELERAGYGGPAPGAPDAAAVMARLRTRAGSGG